LHTPPEPGWWDRLLGFADKNPTGFFVAALGVALVLYFLPAVLRAWRKNGNGHRGGASGETGDIPRPREERRPQHAGETDRMLIELRAHMDAQHEAFCDRLAALEGAINGPDGLQVQVSRAGDDARETKELVVALRRQLATLIAGVAGEVKGAREALSKQLFDSTRDVANEGDKLLQAATGVDVEKLRRELQLRRKPIGEAKAT
jgi:hypothetical protein